MDTEKRLARRRGLLHVSFLAFLLVSGVAFGVTEAGHIAVMQSDSISVTVQSVTLSDETMDSVEITLRFDNPTPRRVDVNTVRQLVVFRRGETIARSTNPTMTPWPIRVPPSGRATTTATLEPDSVDAGVTSAGGADAELTVRGVFGGRIGDVVIELPVDEGSE